MPLYQMILITKCAQPTQTSTLMKTLASKIWQQGGVVREVKILSDRLLAKQMKAIDGQRTLVARYSQVLFDGSPYLMDQVRRSAKLDKTLLKISFFKIKDFYSYAQEYSKDIGSQIDNSNKKKDTARKIAILKEQTM